MRLLAPTVATLLLAGCGVFTLNFGRKITDEESILRTEIKEYYDEAGAAFAAGNAARLADLYDPGIARPMTKDQIRAWGEDFFKKHGPAAFKIEKLDFEGVGHVSAVVELTYRVETKDGDGSFGGVERDELVKHGRHWSISAWTKLR
ncbi:MAG: hypothetical protein KGJ84_16715 [Elusimicrobia bacterium]|nr:hypothetical protein [Elusimicrobiota bacterium]